MLSEIFTISKLIKMFHRLFKWQSLNICRWSPWSKLFVSVLFDRCQHIFGPNIFYSKYTWHECLLTLGALCFTTLSTGKMVRRGSLSRLYRPGHIGFNIFVAFTFVGLILCLHSGNIHLWYIIYQPFDVFCGWWSADAACLFLPPALTDVGQTPYSSQPSKNTYTNTNKNKNTNMDTNTDVSQTPYTSHP